jgi:hypothetical protein
LLSARLWNTSGDAINISGHFVLSDRSIPTVAQAVVLRSQVEGLVNNPDEDAVPIVWSADPSINGWYRVTAAQCSMVGAALATGIFEFGLTVRRVAVAAGHESVVTSRTIANDHGISAVTPWHVPPVNARAYEWPTGTTASIRSTADGVVQLRTATSNAASKARWIVSPADTYKAAATLKVGADTLPVIGHALPAGHDGDWLLDNGLVRCRPAAGNPGMLEVDHYKAGGWIGYRLFKIRLNTTTGYVTSLTDLEILHNAPHRVTIRLNLGPDDVPSSRTLDLTVRRGSLWLYGYLVPVGGATTDWKVQTHLTVAASDALSTSGVLWSEGSNRNRLIVSALDLTTDSNGGVAQVAASADAVMDFGIGASTAAAGSPAAAETDSSQVRQYLAGLAEHPRVVPR